MTVVVEFDVVPGLEGVLEAELATLLNRRPFAVRAEGAVRVEWDVALALALRPRVARAAYLAASFEVSRPRALLGEANLRKITACAEEVMAVHPDGTFRSLRIAAAGSGSLTYQRLATEMASRLGLARSERGDLLVRVRPRPRVGWEVLVSLSPKPLWVRPWHRPGIGGSLEPTVAAAMVLLTGPSPADRFVDATCGSGTLLIERLSWGAAELVAGGDIDRAALAIAVANLETAGFGHSTPVACWDAGRLALASASVSSLCMNLPWGHRFGSHEDNDTLYPALLSEAARVSTPAARLVVLTHELRRFTRCLAEQEDHWRADHDLQISLAGHHPRIWVLHRVI